MNSKQREVLRLRHKGLSYNEINKKLGIPKSTLSNWLSGVELSSQAEKRLLQRVRQGTLNGLVKRNKLQTVIAQQKAKDARQKSSDKIKKLSKSELMIIGAVIYWGEGYKRLRVVNGKERTGHIVSLTNSDPDMISAFILFLEKITEVPRKNIKLNIRIFEHISSQSAVDYWRSVTGLSRENIEKPSYVVSQASKKKRPSNRLKYGTAQVRVNSTSKFYEIMGMIDGLKKRLDSYGKS